MKKSIFAFTLAILFAANVGANTHKTILNHAPNTTDALIDRAHELIGTPYRWGGSTVKDGFDCSGFMTYLFRSQAGIKLPRTARSMYREAGKSVSRSQLKRGDAVFFKSHMKKPVSHVGIYIGNDNFIHAPSAGKVTRVDSLSNGYWGKRYFSAKRLY